jgi:hypothetical protein
MTRKTKNVLENKSCTHIYLEILQNIKYDVTIILLYDTMHYRGDIYLSTILNG